MDNNNQMQVANQVKKTGLATYANNWQRDLANYPVRIDTPANDIYNLNTPAISSLGELNGIRVGIDVLVFAFMGIADFLDLRWNKSQLLELAQLAYDQYYWLNLAEIKQFCMLVKTGSYEHHKNISPAILFGFLNDYCDKMLYERAEYYKSKKQHSNRKDPNPDLLPEIDKQLRENKTAYKEGRKSKEQYEKDYQRLFMEYQDNTPVKPEQFTELIAKFTDRLKQDEERAELEMQNNKLRYDLQQKIKRQNALDLLPPDQKELLIAEMNLANERNEKLKNIAKDLNMNL